MEPYSKKCHWPIGTILEGVYYIGHSARRYSYYRVVGFTRTKAPRVEALEQEETLDYFLGAPSATTFSLADPVRAEDSDEIFSARWGSKMESWYIKRSTGGKDKKTIFLDVHTPGSKNTVYWGD